ncbi:hypothetical protein M8U01_14790 [Enterobacter hormaechei]|nr:hypothetical protein [Enterobacter hormaechei]
MKAIIHVNSTNDSITIQLCGVGATEVQAREKAFGNVNRVVNVSSQQYQGGQCVTASQEFIDAYNVEPVWDSRFDETGKVVNSLNENSHQFIVDFLESLFIDENGELNCRVKSVQNETSDKKRLVNESSAFRHAMDIHYKYASAIKPDTSH